MQTEIRAGDFCSAIENFVPLYHYINFARRIILYNEMPSVFTWVVCALTAIVTLIVGIIVFRKNQDKFISFIY